MPNNEIITTIIYEDIECSENITQQILPSIKSVSTTLLQHFFRHKNGEGELLYSVLYMNLTPNE